jgi:hypothetical protein
VLNEASPGYTSDHNPCDCVFVFWASSHEIYADDSITFL